jgi:hypothetical protein
MRDGGGIDRHARDIASAIAISGDSTDMDWVHAEIMSRDLHDGWAEVSRRLGLMAEEEKRFREESGRDS